MTGALARSAGLQTLQNYAVHHVSALPAWSCYYPWRSLLCKVLILVRQRLRHGRIELGLILLLLGHVYLDLGRREGHLLHKVQVWVPAQQQTLLRC